MKGEDEICFEPASVGNNNDCLYNTKWELSNGSISLSITNEMRNILVYQDKANTEKLEKEQLEDL